MKKIVILVLAVFILAGCTVKDREIEITVFHHEASSVYTGKVKGKIPDGEGTAVLDDNARVRGIFEKGTWISGEAADIPFSITYGDQDIQGVYTGEVSNQLPQGTGSFTSDSFSYNGTWINGKPEGQGTLSAEYFCINTPSEVLEGSYNGDVDQGLAEGNGTFIYQSGNHEIQMDGSFTGNYFDGILVKTIRYRDTVKSYPVYYQKGWQIHSAAAMIAYLEGMRNESYCLSEPQLSFISDHSTLFEGTSKDIPGEYDPAFDYKTFSEDSKPSLVLIRNAAIKSVQRYKPYTDADTITSMIVQTTDGWYHLVFVYSVDSADQGEIADFYVLPLCRSTLKAPEQEYPAIDAAGAVVIEH